jgi:drug/metabolite transporter (DMT)-like permease
MILNPVYVGGAAVALIAAATFGMASILQHRAARRAPQRPAARPRLMLDLFHDRRWRWSVILATVAFGLQITALKLLPLLFVQPLLVTGLLWYVIGSALTDRRPPDRLLILATAGCLAGLSALLLIARPKAAANPSPIRLLHALPLALALALAGLIAGCLVLSARIPPAWRSLPLALASGICYGVIAGLVRSLSHSFGAGIVVILSQWQTYAIAVLGPLSVLLSQNAYQSGRLGSPALAIITVADPLASIAIGIVWLHETIRTSTPALIGEVAALLTLTVSVFFIAERAPKVRGEEQPGQPVDAPADKSKTFGG